MCGRGGSVGIASMDTKQDKGRGRSYSLREPTRSRYLERALSIRKIDGGKRSSSRADDLSTSNSSEFLS